MAKLDIISVVDDEVLDPFDARQIAAPAALCKTTSTDGQSPSRALQRNCPNTDCCP